LLTRKCPRGQNKRPGAAQVADARLVAPRNGDPGDAGPGAEAIAGANRRRGPHRPEREARPPPNPIPTQSEALRTALPE